MEMEPNPIHNYIRVNRWFSGKRVKVPADFEGKISVKEEEGRIKIYRSSYEEKRKKKKLKKSKERIGVKKEEVHTKGGKEEWD